MSDICRAITFISYHIPLPSGDSASSQEDGSTIQSANDSTPQYSTLGFFDGMFSERLSVNYNEDGLRDLWKYTIRRTAESKGKFSYQNIFAFSDDSWNNCTDEEFWSEDANQTCPLLFVVFLQLSNYISGDRTIEQQCKAFNRVLKDNISQEEKKMYYTYGTVDKNDFVVCLRCRNHTRALNAIKKLHNTDGNMKVVYSYSVLSVSNKVLDEMTEQKYPYLYGQTVDSISLKGVTNSFRVGRLITLDQRYYEFCNKLITQLYTAAEKDQAKRDREYCIYDILGDDDFRLIARNVNLGKLLREFGRGGLLSNYQEELRFYLYSSSLILNTLTEWPNRSEEKQVCLESPPQIPILDKEKISRVMNEKMKSPLCEELSQHMGNILKTIQVKEANEKDITFCQALWQLLQSLKVLESAPTKKYDFYSLYHPFSVLARILENNINQKELVRSNETFDFIHKISMTLHGTLRTDIQFFQIRDFNVVVHYAPAKLRAFYAIWALKLSDFYKAFQENDKNYSFILSPGVFGETQVKQLFIEYNKEEAPSEQLMLITTPERNLYSPRWLSLIIAHEVSHFVGRNLRERVFRHKILLRLSVHIAALEMQSFWYTGISKLSISAERMVGSLPLRDRLKKELVRIDEKLCKEQQCWYLYHSRMSQEIVRQDYRAASNNDIIKRIIAECGEILRNELLVEAEMLQKDLSQIGAIQDKCNAVEEEMLLFAERFQNNALTDILRILHYICTETFADIIALLTLGLSPTDYVTSFVKIERPENTQNLKINSMGLLPIRIAVTMEAIRTIAHENEAWLSEYAPDWAKTWDRDVLSDTLSKFEEDSDAYNIMLQVLGYTHDLIWKKKNIAGYCHMYNPNSKHETFSNRDLDFLNDKNVYRLLCEYMNKCADTYFSKIRNDWKLRTMRENLLQTYEKLARGSMLEMMQEVETFLQKNEKIDLSTQGWE